MVVGGVPLKRHAMFGLFKPKDPKEKLRKQYERLLQEAHALSTRDRKASDIKRAEAEEVIKRLEALEQAG